MEDWGADLSPRNFATAHFSLQNKALLSPRNFATTHLTAYILNFYISLELRRTLSQRPKSLEKPGPQSPKKSLEKSPKPRFKTFSVDFSLMCQALGFF